MTASKPRIKLPDTVKLGDIIEVKTLITHVMETGNRKDREGRSVPRDIIHSFVAKFNTREVFRAELGPGISANPYIAFQMRVDAPGAFEFSWTEDNGTTTTETAPLTIA